MKIDFKQLAKLEKQYSNNGYNLSLNTLQMILNQVLDNSYNIDSMGLEHSKKSNEIAISTLKELGVLIDDNKKETQQLNS